MARGVSESAYESVVQTLRRADLTRRIAENYDPNLYGHAGLKQGKPEMLHPPLTVRPRTAQARLEALKSPPPSPKGPPKPPPVKPGRPMKDMHASYLKSPAGDEVWTLCANSYDLNNSYNNEKARFMRIAKPDNWRLDKAAAANDAALRGEEARKLISSMEQDDLKAVMEGGDDADAEETGVVSVEPDSHGNLNSSMRSLRSAGSARSAPSGIAAIFPPGISSTNDLRPSTRETIASQRSVWSSCPDPEAVCQNVPACASGSHRLLRPHTAQSRLCTGTFATSTSSKWSAPGAKVYKRPESAQNYSGRNLQHVTSPIASYVRSAPESAKPKPRPGLSNYCSALSTMNREMVRG